MMQLLEQENLEHLEHGNNQDVGLSIVLDDETETVLLGEAMAALTPVPFVIYLYGDLGAGKTTFVRGLLQGKGHRGAVKSPTYTLVEPYEFGSYGVYHFDLYRLADPEELEFIGIREYQQDDSVLLFEWPDKGAGMIPPADLTLYLEYQGDRRVAHFAFHNQQKGQEIVQKIRQKLAKLL